MEGKLGIRQVLVEDLQFLEMVVMDNLDCLMGRQRDSEDSLLPDVEDIPQEMDLVDILLLLVVDLGGILLLLLVVVGILLRVVGGILRLTD